MSTLNSNIAKGKNGKPLLGVIGFLGRGNSGDEAIFQCIYESFNEDFDILAVVDETGAWQGYWDWYPYDSCERIHVGNIHYFEKRLAGLLVGGGGLGLGFGGAQILVAKGAGTPVALAGVDHTHTVDVSPTFSLASAIYLNFFNYVSMRSLKSVSCAMKAGVIVHYGADWALKLSSDQSPNIFFKPKRVIVVLREFALEDIEYRFYREEIIMLISTLRQLGYEPEFMPFCPEDVLFLKNMNLDILAPSLISWWNARALKQVIENSGILISVGRLHPMIYAVASKSPSIQIQPPLRSSIDIRNFSKMNDMAEEFSIPYFFNVSAALFALENEDWRSFFSARRLQEAHGRLDGMVDDLHALFGQG